jgi:hypothetical protein
LPGWKRFDAAQAWLDQHWGADANASAGAEQAQILPDRNSALYQEFLRWRQARGK